MRLARIIVGYVFSLAMFTVVIPAAVIVLGLWVELWLGLWHPQRSGLVVEVVASTGLRLLACALGAWGLWWMAWSWWCLAIVGKGHPTEAFGVEITPVTRQLVSAGPYAYTRNPMVFGYFCVLMGIAVACGSLGMAMAIAVVGAVGWINIIYFEEPRLERRFGDAYREYKRRVPRLRPRRPLRP